MRLRDHFMVALAVSDNHVIRVPCLAPSRLLLLREATKKNEARKKCSEKNVATKLDGGGGKALVAGPLNKNFFAASLS